jgi:hypothetical protein
LKPETTIVKKLLILGLTLILSACGGDEVEPPEHLVSKEEMIIFLIDLHLAEAKINTLAVPHDSAKLLYKHYERYLFEKHGLEDSAYYKSFQYYLHNLQTMDEIYGAVVDSLNVMNTMSRAGEMEVGE